MLYTDSGKVLGLLRAKLPRSPTSKRKVRIKFVSMPKFHELLTDVLLVLSDGQRHHIRALSEDVLKRKDLTDAERAETMKGGGNRARSRAYWALEYLCQAGAARRPARGLAEITDLGKKMLAENPSGISLALLKQTDGLKEWKRRTLEKRAARNEKELPTFDDDADEINGTPHEQIESAVKDIESTVASQLLQRLREENPEFLERTVLKLLHAMGYGIPTSPFAFPFSVLLALRSHMRHGTHAERITIHVTKCLCV